MIKHCEGHTAVLRNHMLRLKSSTLEALYLDGSVPLGRISPRLPEDSAVLMRKSVYNDQPFSHPTFPYSVNGGSPILAMNDGGNLEHFQLQDLLSSSGSRASHSSLDSRTTCFTPVQLHPTGQQLVVTGDEDGWLKVWSPETNDLLGAECLFNCPVQVIEPSPFTEKGTVSELYVLSEDGTIAVYDLEQMALVFLIPGSQHAVEAVLSSGKDIVIAYSSGKTRVWDLDTLQFRRSTGVEAAEESLVSRTWLPLFQQSGNSERDLTKPALSTIHLKPGSLKLEDAGVLLHSLHTWNLQADIDNAIHSLIPSVKDRRPSLRLLAGNTMINDGRASWQVSGRHTAWRQLLLVGLAHRYLAEPETEIEATKVITFYASILQDAVGPAFCTGDIATYVEYYDHTDRKSIQEVP
jgi:WD40 repeat protein